MYNVIVQEPFINITKHKAEMEYKVETKQNKKDLLDMMKLHIDTNLKTQESRESISQVKILNMVLERNNRVYRLVDNMNKLYFLKQVPIYDGEKRRPVNSENEKTIDFKSDLCPVCACQSLHMKEHLLYEHNLLRVFLDDDPYKEQISSNPESQSKEENIKCDKCSFTLHRSLPQLMAHHQLMECDGTIYKNFIETIKMYQYRDVLWSGIGNETSV